ncbi:hypothetical protein [Halosimplex amylolyticum]|uniref:HoxN/HupN/NixA family nickel/cobalt transporter n=1 Tax=Halosimplex amylolyticum TaxID=3396616 RepID=UPI003F57FA86
MSAPLWGALATAGVLGVTHAIEPDHVAGISSVTSQYGDSRLSALVGACFSLGHVALVVVWLIGGYLLLGRTEFPAVFDTVGTLGVAVLLGALGAAMAVGGLRSMRHTHVHEHDGRVHAHPHIHLPLVGSDHDHGETGDPVHGETDRHAHDGHDADSRDADSHHDDGPADGVVPHAHGHGVGAYLKTGVVGALFTLSPPISMIVFASTLFPDYGGGAVALAVGAYAVSITATMSAIGAGVGTLFGVTAVSPRLHAGARVLGGVIVVGFAVSMLPGTLL